jgi:DNA-binding response OmpR family regulator
MKSYENHEHADDVEIHREMLSMNRLQHQGIGESTIKQISRRAVETVFVVEDEEMLRELLASTLEQHGYRVLSAEDGDAAVNIFQQESENIDVVIADMGLPKQSGFDVFLKMKRIKPEVNVIIMGGYLELDTQTSLLHAGVKAVIEKPFLNDDVLRVIRAVCGSAMRDEERVA